MQPSVTWYWPQGNTPQLCPGCWSWPAKPSPPGHDQSPSSWSLSPCSRRPALSPKCFPLTGLRSQWHLLLKSLWWVQLAFPPRYNSKHIAIMRHHFVFKHFVISLQIFHMKSGSFKNTCCCQCKHASQWWDEKRKKLQIPTSTHGRKEDRTLPQTFSPSCANSHIKIGCCDSNWNPAQPQWKHTKTVRLKWLHIAQFDTTCCEVIEIIHLDTVYPVLSKCRSLRSMCVCVCMHMCMYTCAYMCVSKHCLHLVKFARCTELPVSI